MIDDTTVASAQEGHGDAPWLLLIHRLPPKPDYLRVKAQRRLRALGARAIKNSVYALPRSDDNLEDFEWLARELREEGGEVMICEASFVGGVTNGDVAAMFEQPAEPAPERRAHVQTWTGKTWVTREGVKVDRIGSAWLIRRFVDPNAQFKFVPARGYRPAIGEVRFDMYEGDIGHENGQCTFETMLALFGLGHGALAALGEIIHDVDLKDGKFGRPEAGGLKAMIEGLVRAHPDDDAARLEAGAPLYDALYVSLGGRLPESPGNLK